MKSIVFLVCIFLSFFGSTYGFAANEGSPSLPGQTPRPALSTGDDQITPANSPDIKGTWQELSQKEKVSFLRGFFVAANYVVMNNKYTFPEDFDFDADKNICLDIFWKDDSDNKIYSRKEARKISHCSRFLAERNMNRFRKDNVRIGTVVTEVDKMVMLPETSRLAFEDIVYLAARKANGASSQEIDALVKSISIGVRSGIQYKDPNGNDIRMNFP